MKSAIAIASVSVVSCLNIEREPLLTWAPTPKADSFKMNYGVSHFGEDKEITYTKKNIKDAEQKLGHELDTSDPPADPKRGYFVPNFGVDTDIKSSLSNLSNQEKLYGNWNLPESEWF